MENALSPAPKTCLIPHRNNLNDLYYNKIKALLGGPQGDCAMSDEEFAEIEEINSLGDEW